MDVNEINTRLLIWRKKGSPENEIIKRIYSNSDSRDK